MYLRNNWRWPLGYLLFLAIGCNHSKVAPLIITSQDSIVQKQLIVRAFDSIDIVKNIIKTGDLIVRTGNDFTSESLRGLNQRDQTYSHCGIASIENDTLFVYHALGGEFNPDQKIKREIFKNFSEPYSNRGIGIYRFGIRQADIAGCIQMAKQLYQEGVMFDMEFDLKTNNRMYCAEFVYKSYTQGSQNKLAFNISHIKTFEFIGVDDLFLHPLCTLQKKLVYK
ncbi:MAG: hypothetical protein IPJ81_01535 [Chitinophagaceae bacterium]|nr:hypothetical protein [Chitinophagaceae bacterium]